MSKDKNEFYLGLAEKVSEQSTCLRSHFGAIIVNHDMVVGMGYNGPARGVEHCKVCRRKDCLSGAGYDLCIAVHAESNSILQAGGRAGCLGGSLYLGSHNRKWNGTRYNEGMGDFPCDNCGRLIIQAGIECVYQREEDGKIVGHLIQNLVKVGKLF